MNLIGRSLRVIKQNAFSTNHMIGDIIILKDSDSNNYFGDFNGSRSIWNYPKCYFWRLGFELLPNYNTSNLIFY